MSIQGRELRAKRLRAFLSAAALRFRSRRVPTIEGNAARVFEQPSGGRTADHNVSGDAAPRRQRGRNVLPCRPDLQQQIRPGVVGARRTNGIYDVLGLLRACGATAVGSMSESEGVIPHQNREDVLCSNEKLEGEERRNVEPCPAMSCLALLAHPLRLLSPEKTKC